MVLNLRASDTRESWRRWLYAYRSLLFHAAYGVPMALVTLFDGLKVLDLSPLLSTFMTPTRVAATGTLISVTALCLHFYSDTHPGTMRDCPRPDGSCGEH